MTATNHTITGAIIGASISQPLLAIPIALGSHLVLDALPHFGRAKFKTTDKEFFVLLGSDSFVAASFLGLIIFTHPSHWLLMVICGIIAASPDLLWFPYWVVELRGKKRQHSPLARFLSWIQWGERPYGWIFELMWFLPASYYLILLLGR